MRLQVKRTPEFHNNFGNLFLFFKNNFQEFIIASSFIIKAILNPFLATFHVYSVQGIFQHHFQCKKVHTILNKIWYLGIRFE